jgi:hypothetical protein
MTTVGWDDAKRRAEEARRSAGHPVRTGADRVAGQRRLDDEIRSVLRAYVEALGGRLKVIAEFDDSGYPVAWTYVRPRPAHQTDRRHKPQVKTVGRRGLEPRTYGLKVHSSAIELAARG